MNENQLPGDAFAPIEDVDALIAMLSDPDSRVIGQAALSASWSGYEDRRVVQALISLMEHEDQDVRWAAVMGLGHEVSGDVGAAFIRHAKHDPAPQVRAACVSHLYKGGSRSADALNDAQDDPDPAVRVQVALSQIHARSRRGTQLLRNLLADPDWDVRLAACKVCLHHEISDDQIIQTLEQLSQDPKAAEHDKRMQEHRAATHQRLAGSDFLEAIDTASRTLPEILAHAKDLASRRRGIWSVFSR